ncbi:helix-turn-helix domain-containing protein [Proteus myxofaciens]|uniref:HTH cro/C1-type domain-containing protein n=1 Tax=Proteus myxofaciens ATCC 19692 TaxID=1354337 RepID=A0A198FQS5_9GAMM|nr:helix-turn-helix transcriptional regulator [Proteus myxofaciens]OAT26491.1 hypothetical protein M983_2128 [Proteus myxofaciens ATCC 19692]
MKNKKKKIDIKIGHFIRQRRLVLGLNGKDLAEKLNLSQQQISRYERGECSFSFYTLILFLKALDEDINNYIKCFDFESYLNN